MMIPLPLEEYFREEEDNICNNCYAIINLSHHFYLPDDEIITLCYDCSFGVYQCTRCHQLVSNLDYENYREMVYIGPENTWDTIYIFCRECFEFLQEEDDNTDTEEDDVFICGLHTETQSIF